MSGGKKRGATSIALASFLLAWACAFSGPAKAQTNAEPEHSASALSPVDEYRIGPGDVVSVTVLEAPELGGKFRVNENGDLTMAVIPAPVHAEGQTAYELSRTIKHAFIEAKQLRDPSVNVYVEEFHGRTVTVTGAVAKPSVYPIPPRTTVLEALALAGGLLPTAGSTVTVVRGAASAESTGTAVGSVVIVDLNRLVKGKDSSVNIEVQKGDVISVPTAELVYVVGAVTKPGGFAMPDPVSGMSVVQAIAMAEGFTSVAATHNGLIIRQSTDAANRREIPVDIGHVLSAGATDVRLAPNDILYVPDSFKKKSLKAMGDVAIAAVSGIAIYGVGYRVGGVK
jgi:polysaccharide biosynthesis/export protein